MQYSVVAQKTDEDKGLSVNRNSTYECPKVQSRFVVVEYAVDRDLVRVGIARSSGYMLVRKENRGRENTKVAVARDQVPFLVCCNKFHKLGSFNNCDSFLTALRG